MFMGAYSLEGLGFKVPVRGPYHRFYGSIRRA